MDGFLLVNKRPGMTSFDVVKEVKKVVGNVKVGHSGTLDPETEGLLVLALGSGTKFLKEITKDSKKVYVAKCKFGIETATGDIYGTKVFEEDISLKEEDILKTFKKFEKTYDQIPPLVSAKKINGKRAYDIARENPDFDMSFKASRVTIFSNTVLNINTLENVVSFESVVSKGTYIRSLITDIALDLGTVGTMIHLKRTFTDGFSLDNAICLEDDVLKNIITIDQYIRNSYKYFMKVDGKLKNLISNGMTFENEEIVLIFDNNTGDGSIVFVDDNDDKIIAIYMKKETKYVPNIML